MATRLRLASKTVERYRAQLDLATRRYEAEAQPVTERMQMYLRGQQWAAQGAFPKDRIQKLVANLIFADVKVMLPALALRNPRVFVKPSGAMMTQWILGPTGPMQVPIQVVNGKPVRLLEAAKAKEALGNWRWRTLRINQQVRRCLVDALTAPFGIMKLGYTLTTDKVSLPENPVEGGATVIEPHELIKAESPFAVRWSPAQFRVDPEARYPDLSDAQWIAFGWIKRLDDVKNTEKYRNTRDLRGTVEARTQWDMSSGSRASASDFWKNRDVAEDEIERVQGWDIWDKREHKLITLADDHDKALYYEDWPQAYQNFPAETLCFTEHPDQLYGPPDLSHVLDQQHAYNVFNSMIFNHVRRWGPRKMAVTRGTLDEKETAKYQEPEDGLVLQVDGKIPESMGAVPDAPIPVDVWQARVNFREDHDRTSGMSDFMRSQAEKVDTATEANLIQSNTNVRTNDARTIVEDFAERITKQILLIDAQTLNVPRAVPVLGPDGVMALNEYIQIADRETLLAETDVEVEIGSMQPINQQARKRDLQEVYKMFLNDPLVDQFKLRRLITPAYRDTIPDLEGVLLTREQFAVVAAQMGVGGAPSPGAGAGIRPFGSQPPGSAPGRPAGARPMLRPAPRPGVPTPAMNAGRAGRPAPQPQPIGQEV